MKRFQLHQQQKYNDNNDNDDDNSYRGNKKGKYFHENKTLDGSGIKPFFRLHPPRGGINTKYHFPKGVLGENKEINKLILRML